jgi:hypothetical protein
VRKAARRTEMKFGFTLGMMTGFAWGKKETVTEREEEAQR